MVQSTQKGIKTMTRRVKGFKAINEAPDTVIFKRLEVRKGVMWAIFEELTDWPVEMKCPYGNVGDVLWVRETSAITVSSGPSRKLTRWYKADNPVIPANVKFKWKPSIFMPKGSCRIKLEITDIRVERLQDISEDDAKSEGVEQYIYSGRSSYFAYKDYLNRTPHSERDILDATGSFISLWASINGEGSWESNPWVWVISFKKINHG